MGPRSDFADWGQTYCLKAWGNGFVCFVQDLLHEIRKESNPPKSLRADHLFNLFKLNGAVFNLSEEDAVDGPLALQSFQAVERIQAYNAGKYDNSDSKLFSDHQAWAPCRVNASLAGPG
ncbi:unnamed protein product [Effrenium voratum]|nr:unnamed protein product [Effrenium voratum]CAJ1458398.1 unnamed protein product [Effrenium voratum]